METLTPCLSCLQFGSKPILIEWVENLHIKCVYLDLLGLLTQTPGFDADLVWDVEVGGIDVGRGTLETMLGVESTRKYINSSYPFHHWYYTGISLSAGSPRSGS